MKPIHASDCALHAGPALEPGPCDCGAEIRTTCRPCGAELPGPCAGKHPECPHNKEKTDA